MSFNRPVVLRLFKSGEQGGLVATPVFGEAGKGATGGSIPPSRLILLPDDAAELTRRRSKGGNLRRAAVQFFQLGTGILRFFQQQPSDLSGRRTRYEKNRR